jgi:hypothetical protein
LRGLVWLLLGLHVAPPCGMNFFGRLDNFQLETNDPVGASVVRPLTSANTRTGRRRPLGVSMLCG